MNRLFGSGGQSIGASPSATDLPMNILRWFHLGFAGSISLQSRGLSKLFSGTIIQKHQFLNAQSSCDKTNTCTWLFVKPPSSWPLPRAEYLTLAPNSNPLQYSCLENPHGQMSLAGYSPWGCKGLGMTEQLSPSTGYIAVNWSHRHDIKFSSTCWIQTESKTSTNTPQLIVLQNISSRFKRSALIHSILTRELARIIF